MRVVAIEEHFATQGFRDANSEHPIVREVNQHAEKGIEPYKRLVRQLLDVGEERLASMDAAGIDVQVLSLTTPGAEGVDASTAVGVATEANDALAGVVAAHPTRYAGFATLPTPDPPAAAAELERAVSSLGFVGALINGHIDGRYLDDQFFWPIFEAAEALNVPIYLHPTFPPQGVVEASYSGFSPRVDNALATGAWGWHIDTGLHVLRLMLGGVFDRFPRLQLIVGHLGEALPSMMWRADWTMRTMAAVDRPLQEYFTENVHVTTSGVFDHPPFAAAVGALGVDRILFAADYPYSGNNEARAFLDGLPVSAPDRAKIAHGNADRLLRLGDRVRDQPVPILAR